MRAQCANTRQITLIKVNVSQTNSFKLKKCSRSLVAVNQTDKNFLEMVLRGIANIVYRSVSPLAQSHFYTILKLHSVKQKKIRQYVQCKYHPASGHPIMWRHRFFVGFTSRYRPIMYMISFSSIIMMLQRQRSAM